MPRSHPPTLLTLARGTITRDRLFARGDTVLVAVSGGPDSMALLHVLARLRSALGHAVVAYGVDHGLRPAAGAELDRAADFAQSLGVPFDRARLAVAPGGNLQARARTARYLALRAAAAHAGAACIATAHHATDRAETVLLRLLRGAGPRGLAVLPSCAGDLVRPLIRADRAAIDAHVARHAVPFSLDPSNRDPRFLRARVRAEVLPLLRALSPHIDEHLCALADQLGAVLAASATDASPAEGPTDSPLTLPLARASRQALDALAASRSLHTRVALKGDRVAQWDPETSAVRVAPAREAREPERQTPPRSPRTRRG